ncbi:hypothetical protein [Profundibacter sp.]
MADIELDRENMREIRKTGKRQSTNSRWVDGVKAVFSQLTSAFVRAILVLVVISMPSVLLPGVDADTAQVVALISMAGAVLVFFEYSSAYPSLVEFRDAPPFNRVRYVSLLITVSLVTIIVRGESDPTTLSQFAKATGTIIGEAINFEYSPVNLMILMLPEDAGINQLILIRSIAGLSYLISLMTLVAFLMLIRIQGWPSRGKTFNVWVNLPTFDPSAGSDVVARLVRDGRVNIILGLVLPFLLPVMVLAASKVFDPIVLDSPQTMVWTMTAWAFLPTSLFMRGIAMRRIAAMIKEKRKRSNAYVEKHGYTPA